jgi:hypothetical protein
MNWNDKKIKAIVYNRETQQREQLTLSAKDIIDNPIGKEVEVIVMAIANVTSELVKLKESELERIGELQKRMESQKLNQMELPI